MSSTRSNGHALSSTPDAGSQASGANWSQVRAAWKSRSTADAPCSSVSTTSWLKRSPAYSGANVAGALECYDCNNGNYASPKEEGSNFYDRREVRRVPVNSEFRTVVVGEIAAKQEIRGTRLVVSWKLISSDSLDSRSSS